MENMKALVVGDVHIGHVDADLITYMELLEMGLNEKPDVIIYLGDVIEGVLKYRTQIYNISSFRPIDIQRELFRRFVAEPIVKKRPKAKLVVVKGNHDINYIEDFLKPAFQGTKVSYEYVYRYIMDDTLFVHFLTKRSRGSYITSISPYHVNLSLNLSRQYGVSRIVYAHIHRGFAYIVHGGVEIIVLPSFLRYNDAHDASYTPVMLLIDGDSFKLLKPSRKPEMAEVEMYNIQLMDSVILEIIKKEGRLR